MDTVAGREGREREEDAAAVAIEEYDSGEQDMHYDVEGAHSFILWVSSFCGLAPLKFQSRGNGYTVTISKAMCVYSYIFGIALVIFTVVGLVMEITVLNKNRDANEKMSNYVASQVSQAVLVGNVLVVALTVSAGICTAPQRMRDMFKFMKSVVLVDSNLGAQYVVLKKRKLYAIVLAIMVFDLGVLSDGLLQEIVHGHCSKWVVIVKRFGFYLSVYVILVMELQFALTALSVLVRLKAVNEALSLTMRNIAVPVNDERQPMVPYCTSIRRLVSMHSSLCDAVYLIDKSYGLVLMAILTSNLIHLIITPYLLIIDIITSKEINLLVLRLLWCASNILKMFLVVEQSHRTITEAKRTKVLVCQLMTSLPSTSILPSRLQLLPRQLMLQTVSYSPMGMCTIDRSLVLSSADRLGLTQSRGYKRLQLKNSQLQERSQMSRTVPTLPIPVTTIEQVPPRY